MVLAVRLDVNRLSAERVRKTRIIGRQSSPGFSFSSVIHNSLNVSTDLARDQEFDLSQLTKHMIENEHVNLAQHLRSWASTDNDPAMLRKADRVSGCGQYLAFDQYQSTEDPSVLMRSLRSANFCKDPFCPMCSWRKSRRLLGQLLSIFDQIIDDHKLRFLFLTLTVKNPPVGETRDNIMAMSKAFNLMCKEPAIKRNVLGFVRAIEYLGENTPQGESHPHFHVLLAVRESYFKGGEYLNHEKWVALWRKSLKADYDPLVNVQAVKSKKIKFDDHEIELPAFKAAALEVAKYCVKSSSILSMPEEDFKTLYAQVKGIRKYNLGGLFRNIKPLPEEIDPELWLYLGMIIFKWVKDAQRYEHHKSVSSSPTLRELS